MYFSKKVPPREEKYSTIEKKCLTINLAVHIFRVYLIRCKLTVDTDHCAVVAMCVAHMHASELTIHQVSVHSFSQGGLQAIPWPVAVPYGML